MLITPKRYGMPLALLFALLITFVSGAFAGAGEDVSQKKPPIRSGAEIDYPPFCVVDADGRADGFSIELLRAALKSMGREVTFRTGPWAEVKAWLEHGEVQALPLVGRTPERETVFDFTFPYMSLHGAIVVRSGTTGIQDLADLRGRDVAVMKGDNAEEFLRREDRGIKIHTTPTFEAALRDLSRGLYDAVVIQRLVALRLIQQQGLAAALKIINKPVAGFRQDFCFAVKAGDSETLSLLNEGLAVVMADGTYRHLHAKWFAALELSANHRIIIGGDASYPPFEYLDKNGRPAGYNVDLTRAIAREMGLDIEIRLDDWAKIREALSRGEIDAVQGMFYSAERNREFDFSPPHMTINHVAVVRREAGNPPETLSELAGRRLVVMKGDIMDDFAAKNGFAERVTAVATQEEVLRELAQGRYDCALVARIPALFWIKENGWDHLAVGKRSLLSAEYCYAVPKNRKALLTQLGEGLKVVEETGEFRRIQNKWFGVYGESPPGFAAVLRYVAMVAIPLLLLVLGFFLWSWSLRKKVASRTAELKESRESLLITLHSIGDAVIATDIAGRITRMNKVAERLTGWTFSSACGMMLNQVFQIVNAKTRKAVENPVELVLESGKVVGLANHSVLISRDGTEFQIADTAAPILDENGATRGVILVFSDVTDRYKTEQQLLELGEAVKQASEGVVITDTDGRFIYANQAFEKITGYTLDELSGQTPRILKSGRQDDAFYKNLWETILSGNSWTGRIINKRKDGCFYTAECFISPVKDPEGRTINFVWMTRDISKELSLENMLAQAQKMEAIGRLAGGIAHDFNNLLSIILGYAEMLIDNTDRLHPNYEGLNEILDASHRARGVTQQLLAFGRRQVLEIKTLDINTVISGFQKLLQRVTTEDIRLQIDLMETQGLIRADTSQLEQILMNLAVNAKDAMPDGGVLNIETACVELDENYAAGKSGVIPGRYVMISVSDSGIGMAPETVDKIFEPFFTTKDEGKGTGLGLATVYGIVKQHGGNIWVYSEPGRGTTFKIYLPEVMDMPAVEAKTISRIEAPTVSATIMVVEDDIPVRNLACKIIAGKGHHVIEAINADDAIEKARDFKGKIDLILTDVIMPTMKGPEVCSKISEIHPEVRVLYMSGYTENIIARHGVLKEGVRFLQKPFSKKSLLDKIAKVLYDA